MRILSLYLLVLIGCFGCGSNGQEYRQIVSEKTPQGDQLSLGEFHYGLLHWDSAFFYYQNFFQRKENWDSSYIQDFQNYVESTLELNKRENLKEVYPAFRQSYDESYIPRNIWIKQLNLDARLSFADRKFKEVEDFTLKAIELNQEPHFDSLQYVLSRFYQYQTAILNFESLNPSDLEDLVHVIPNSMKGQLIKVDIHNLLQWLRLNKGQYEEARKIISASDSIVRNFLPFDFKRQVRTKQNLALLNIYSNRPHEAYLNLKEIQKIYLSSSEGKEKYTPPVKARLSTYFASLWERQGNYVRSKEALLNAKDYYYQEDSSRYISQIAVLLQNLINLPSEYNTFSEVKNYYDEALTIVDSNPRLKLMMGDFYFVLAIKYINAKDSDSAWHSINLAKEVFDMSNKLKSSDVADANYHRYLADLYALDDDLEKAKSNYSIALNISNQIPELKFLSSAIELRLSNIFEEFEEYDSALFHIQNSLIKLFKEFEESSIELNPSLPEKEYIDIYTLNSLIKKVEILSSKNRIENSVEGRDLILKTVKLADRCIDSMKLNITEAADRLKFLDKTENLYHFGISNSYDLYTQSQNVDYLNDGFNLIEKAKSNNLLWLIGEVKRLTLIRPSEEIENKLYYYKSKTNEFKNLINKNIDSIEYVRDSLFQYRNQYQNLLDSINSLNPTFSRAKYNTKTISIEDTQNSLDPSEILIEYFRTDSGLYAFSINKNDVNFQKLSLELGFDKRLETFLNEFRKEQYNWSEEHRNNFAKDSRYFYDILIRPLLDNLNEVAFNGRKKLIIVPDGNLGYIPFDMLITSEVEDLFNYKDYPFLVKDYVIRQAYSATLMQELKPKDQRGKEVLAAFAPGYIAPALLANGIRSNEGESCEIQDIASFRALKLSDEELTDILKSIEGRRFDTWEASEEKFKENADKHRILHLTLHGFTNNCDPMYSGLVFTPRKMLEEAGLPLDTTNATNEGILYAYEIYNMDINAELIVMSACQTGLGKIQTGEGIMSLARAFAHAGTPNTVMSLWKVQEGPTRDLMKYFYEYLADGKGKDEALQMAKIKFLDKYQDAHPYYWAGFTLIGDDKPIVEDNWFQKNWWMLAIGLVLLLGIYAVLRKYSSSART